MHILNSTGINECDRKKANRLLNSFVDEFEDLYGEINVVYNVHQLKHVAECVQRNGPLFAYSNYPMEDFIGHLVSFVKAPTDVTTQTSSRYILEKSLHVHLHKSEKAQNFYDKIESRLSFPIAQKVNGSLVIGKPKSISHLNTQEMEFVRNTLKIDESKQINEYNASFLFDQMFYEISTNSFRKRTDDSILFNTESNCFAEIRAILVVDGQLYFLIDAKFAKITDTDCKYVQFLRESTSKLMLIKPESVPLKYAFVKFGNTIAASKFPNLCERN